MPTYVTTSRNQFRVPAGAVNDPPDVPGYMLTAAQDADDRLGVGGAEYCANAAAVAAIPSGRRFIGKLVYRADNDTVYRYVGAGNTAIGSSAPTSAWQSWNKPPTAFTPTLATLTLTSIIALYGISEGLVWFDVVGTVTAIGSTTADTQINSLPAAIVGALGSGSGQYQKAGSTANNSQVELAVYGIGTIGQSATSLRVRARYANAAPGAVTANILGSVITPASGDTMQLHYSGPSAGVL